MKSFKSVRSSASQFAEHWRATAPQRRMPAGAKAGLSLVALACLSLGTLSYQAFGPRDVIAHQAVSQAI